MLFHLFLDDFDNNEIVNVLQVKSTFFISRVSSNFITSNLIGLTDQYNQNLMYLIQFDFVKLTLSKFDSVEKKVDLIKEVIYVVIKITVTHTTRFFIKTKTKLLVCKKSVASKKGPVKEIAETNYKYYGICLKGSPFSTHTVG